MPTDLLTWVQIGCGVVIALGGLVVMAWKRVLWQVLRQTPGRHDPVPPGGVIGPTRLVTGVVLVFAGYHIAAWALPAHVLSVQLSREWWWVWGLAGVLAVGLSVVIDRMEGEGGGGGGGEGVGEGEGQKSKP